MSAPYQAPLPFMRLALEQAARSSGWCDVGALAGSLELLEPVLEGAARLAREVLSPLNGVGDAQGSRLEAGTVRTPPGFPQAYRHFREGGWTALAAPEDVGGQGLPLLIGAAATEMWAGANLAFAMCPESAVGAIEALRRHAAPALRERYLPGLVSGESTATMCLTEPQAGSDLSDTRTRAEPDAQAWRLYGRKIYISWGAHDLTEDIVHLVLARTPGAPAGTRGLSLFLVPRRVAGAGGAAVLNDIQVVSIEHKMGIRASPTCVLAFGDRDGARGWLVGERNDGLGCMFTVMNHMRLGVGLHSTGVAERALQLAHAHARERIQGRGRDGSPQPIIAHADVRRMLLGMRSLTHASRALAYHAAAQLDLAHCQAAPDRERSARRLALLTPLVKAWCSEVAVEVASLGVQVHGGLGFMEECEASQVYRDARIGPIFEGTNYIQAQDLLARKVLRDEGAALEALLADIERAARSAAGTPAGTLCTELPRECERLRRATRALIAARPAPARLGAIAHPYLHWLGIIAGGWQWLLSLEEISAQPDAWPESLARAVRDGARFYAAHVLPRAHGLGAVVVHGAESVLEAGLEEP